MSDELAQTQIDPPTASAAAIPHTNIIYEKMRMLEFAIQLANGKEITPEEAIDVAYKLWAFVTAPY